MARILVIDDDDLLRSVLAAILRQAGHTVEQAKDGHEALKIFRRERADLVITDIVMPDQDGIGTILELRRIDPAVPIIAMSGGVERSSFYLDIARKVGAKRILSKPFQPADALRLVAELLAPKQE